MSKHQENDNESSHCKNTISFTIKGAGNLYMDTMKQKYSKLSS